MAYKKGQDRRQRVLFPDCIDEYVEADAPVRLFDAFVDNLKMNELGFVRSTPAETGTPGYDPRDLLKLYIYGYFYHTPQPVRERLFWDVSHRAEPLSRLHLSPSKGIYFFILKFCFMLNNSS